MPCLPSACTLGRMQARDQCTYLIWEFSLYICPKTYSEPVNPSARHNRAGFGANNALHQLEQLRSYPSITLGLIHQSIPAAMVPVSSPHWQPRDMGLGNHKALIQVSLCFSWSMLCGLIHSHPKCCSVKLSHIFQSGPPDFVKCQLFWIGVKHSHNTWLKNNQLFAKDQVLAVISHSVL